VAGWPALSPLEALRAGQRVTLVDRDTPERLGGLALWAFGGMALVGTPLQAKMKIPDTPELALRDWLRFGELGPNDVLPRQWAQYYVEHSRAQVHDWLIGHGLKFMPAVNWVERGLQGDGNSVPRYHVVWGTSRQLTRRMIEVMRASADTGGRLTLLHRHCVTALRAVPASSAARWRSTKPPVPRCNCTRRWWCWPWAASTAAMSRRAPTGPKAAPCPKPCSTAPIPVCRRQACTIWCAGWAGKSPTPGRCGTTPPVSAPVSAFRWHGLSTIPCKSALWLNHRGERIGPEPLVTGFDTNWLCQRVAEQEKPYTWHLLNWRIAAKEFAISGAEHNQRIRDMQFPPS
jgi:predicted oxidoreductase